MTAVLSGLHIVGPTRRTPGSATATCRCGYRKWARGTKRVLALIEAYTQHKNACTGQPDAPSTDRSAA